MGYLKERIKHAVRFRHKRGYGVHSPFMFNLILNVIQNIFALNYRIIPVFFLVIFELLILIYRLLLQSLQTDFEVQVVVIEFFYFL